MSQAPNPFTQAASQGYGDFQETMEEEEEEENDNDGPQSPEPEQEEEEEEDNEVPFTQTQERDYPGGDDEEEEGPASPTAEDEGPASPVPEDEGPASPAAEDEGPASPPVEEEEEEEGPSSPPVEEVNRKQSQQRRKVQIMNDSDDDEEEQPVAAPPRESTSAVPKENNRNFLKQFTMKNEKPHKKRHSDEHHEKKSKRFREEKQEETENIEATSDVDDVVDDIFGKDMDEERENDQAEVAAELAELNDTEGVQEEEEEEEEEEQQQTFDDEGGEDETKTRKENFPKSGNVSYDIDLYLEKKAEKRRGNRRRGGKNGDVDLAGPDSDQIVSHLINQMKIATEEDRVFNKNRQPATAKLLLLPVVEQQLCRADLTEIFLDNGILTVFKDWLSPLPDKSLPNIKIRQSLIRILQQFGVVNADVLRDSGIGKALMYLYKHPRETKENKIKLIKIIHDWARPIFNLDTDYKHLTREERQQRDEDQASLKRQTSLTSKPKTRSADVDLPFASDRRDEDMDNDECPRARVPRPSNKDYLVRPVSTVEYSDKKGDGKKKTISRLDEVKRKQQERKRNSKPMSIVKLSIEGNKMHL